jgi:hypothetical protein
MSNSDNYRALLRPKPELLDGKIVWGWDVTLTDKFDDKNYEFAGGPEFPSAKDAVNAGGVAIRRWMDALAEVKEVGVQEVNLDAPLPPDPEPEPEANPETEEKPVEGEPQKETSEAEKPETEDAK